jgi:hypothetical protein
MPIRPKVEIRDGKTRTGQEGGMFLLRAGLIIVVVPALLFLSYAAFALQGEREDFPSKPLETWPIGVSALVLAAALAWFAARPSRGSQPLIVAIALLFFFLAWAIFLL